MAAHADPCKAVPDHAPASAKLLHQSFSGRVTYVGDGDSLCVALLDQLRPVLRRLRGTSKPSPGQLAKLLNAEGWTTAQGRRWDERKVILLLRLMAERSARRRSLKGKSVPPPKAPKAAHKIGREPLSPEEMARRLSALGRIKG